MSVLFYRRPDYTAQPRGPINASDCAEYVERARCSERAIPPGLSFEEVVGNKALPPCSLNDFMDYLIYVELNAENLQFYIWYHDYVRRFNALSKAEQGLSPEWKEESKDTPPKLTKEKDGQSTRKPSVSAPVINYWDGSDLGYTFDIGLPGIRSDDKMEVKPDVKSDSASTLASTVDEHTSHSVTGNEYQSLGGLKWQPFSVQPFREEVNRVIRHYMTLGAPRELNISHKDRSQILHALQHTTHPSAFLPAITVAEATLRGQSHPNFVRWSICNGSKPRVFLIRSSGAQGILLGLVADIILTLSKQSRWWRILPSILLFVGATALVAAWKGICILLHYTRSHTLRPWEIEDDPESPLRASNDTGSTDDARILQFNALGTEPPNSFDDFSDNKEATLYSRTNTSTTHSDDSLQKTRGGHGSISIHKQHSRWLAPFGPKNTWEDESWVEKYEKRPYLRKAFERQTWTQNETLKILQDKIVMGSYVWGLILTIPVTVAFVALPAGNYF